VTGTPLGRYAAVLFDLDDTLHDDTTSLREAARRAAAEIPPPYGTDVEAVVDSFEREALRFWCGLSSEHLVTPMVSVRERMWAATLGAHGIDDDGLAVELAASYNRHRAGTLQPYPDALPLLAALRTAGCKTALITNGFAATHRDKLRNLGFEDAFDAVLLADEVGMVKPDPRIFLRACELVGVPAAGAVMVGDRYDRDIRGAIDAGLRTVWLNERGAAMPAGAPAPDVEARSFGEVVGALGVALAPGRNEAAAEPV
jgi:putative hydrolase of the HAD superfamily